MRYEFQMTEKPLLSNFNSGSMGPQPSGPSRTTFWVITPEKNTLEIIFFFSVGLMTDQKIAIYPKSNSTFFSVKIVMGNFD